MTIKSLKSVSFVVSVELLTTDSGTVTTDLSTASSTTSTDSSSDTPDLDSSMSSSSGEFNFGFEMSGSKLAFLA